MNAKCPQGILFLAAQLDNLGFYKEADAVEVYLSKISKTGNAQNYQSPSLLADSLHKIVNHLMYRADPEKRIKYLQSVKAKLTQVNPLDISQKNPNPSTAIGAAINIVKNVLIGQHPSTIAAVLAALQTLL